MDSWIPTLEFICSFVFFCFLPSQNPLDLDLLTFPAARPRCISRVEPLPLTWVPTYAVCALNVLRKVDDHLQPDLSAKRALFGQAGDVGSSGACLFPFPCAVSAAPSLSERPSEYPNCLLKVLLYCACAWCHLAEVGIKPNCVCATSRRVKCDSWPHAGFTGSSSSILLLCIFHLLLHFFPRSEFSSSPNLVFINSPSCGSSIVFLSCSSIFLCISS